MTSNGVVAGGSGTGGDNQMVRWDGSTNLQGSGITIDDSDNMSGVLSVAGAAASTLTLNGPTGVDLQVASTSVLTALAASVQITEDLVHSGDANWEIRRLASTVGAGSLTTIIGQDALAASAANGGNLYLFPGLADGAGTHGDISLRSAIDEPHVTVNDDVTIASDTQTVFQESATFALGVSSTELDIGMPLLSFRSTVVSPLIRQDDDNTASVTADALTIQGQRATGATSTGGNVVILPGTGTSTDGELLLQDADANTRVRITSLGDVIVPFAAQVQLGSVGWHVFSTAAYATATAAIRFTGAVASPLFYQDDDASGTAGDTLTVRAQNVTTTAGTITAGQLSLIGGSATGSGTGSRAGGAVLIQAAQLVARSQTSVVTSSSRAARAETATAPLACAMAAEPTGLPSSVPVPV